MTIETEERDHALDNLRAIMMWLGVVLHMGDHYLVHPSTLPWHDTEKSMVADTLVGAIHAFRMPTFFIVAGFFAALLIERRGPGGFLRHRLLRLGLPFLVFWPPVWLATWAAGQLFLNRMTSGAWSVEVLPGAGQGLPQPSTYHLWFLWLLLWFCVIAAGLARLPRAPFAAAGRAAAWLARSGWGWILLAVPVVVAGLSYDLGLLMVSMQFLPPWPEWLHHGVFFAFGFVLYAHRDALLPHLRRCWRRYAWGGLVGFLAFGAIEMASRRSTAALGFAYNSAAWLWSFAALGFAQQVLERRHATLAYLADSAYWVYLVHFPVTLLLGAMMYGLPVFPVLKMLAGIVVTTVVCLASYQLLVRHTWVSVLLNGKRHPRTGMPFRAEGRPAA